MNQTADRTWSLEDEARPEFSRLGFAGFLLGLAVGGAVLWTLAGPPHLPASLPSWESILVTLQGTEPPLEAMAYVITTLAWLLWLWMVGSLALRLIVRLAESISHGAAWARSLRTVSDWVTLPVVRQMVDGAIIAVIVVNLFARAPRASAAPLESAVAAASIAPRPVPSTPTTPPRPQNAASSETRYTVKAGDTLWSIAERFYGNGEAYRRLVDANAGRAMPDGRVFTRAGVIQSGWVLRIPDPTVASETTAPRDEYVVRPGDTLRGIAARTLGDETRWPAIYDLNRGTARLSDGRTLSDPDLIWPGLRLRLPSDASSRPAAPPAVAPSGPPASAVPPAPPTPPATVSPAANPIVPSPTPRATPTSVPTTIQPPSVVPTPAAASPPTNHANDLRPVAIGAGALLAAGGAAIVARRRVRRHLSERPIPRAPRETPRRDEFTDAELTRVLAHRLQGGDGEPVHRVARQALRFLREHGLSDVAVLQATQQGAAVSLLLSANLLDAERLRDAAEEFGTRFGGKCLATLTPDHDVLLRLARPDLAALTSVSDELDERLCLLPIGVGAKGETVWVNWRELGHVALAALPGGGGEIILTSLICALAARRSPEQLHLWTIASPRSVPPRFGDLPQQAHGLVDPDDEAVREVLVDLRAELTRRLRQTEREDSPANGEELQPEQVLVVGELNDLADDEGVLDLIGTYGRRCGVRLVAATADSACLDDDRLACFPTRLVLQTLDDEESIRLLGQPDAADLGRAELFLRLDARTPSRLRGFRVSDDHLADLVDLMAEAYDQRLGQRLSGPEGRTEESDGPDDEDESGPPDVDLIRSDMSFEDVSPCDSATTDIPAQETYKSCVTGGAADAAPSKVQVRSDGGGGALLSDLSGESAGSIEANGAVDEPNSPTAAPDTDTDAGLFSASDSIAATAEPAPPCRTATPIQIQCFGDFRARSGDRELRPVGEEKPTNRSWEVLAFLAAHPAGPVSKQKLFAAIWPDSDDQAAGNCLRQALFHLRAALARQIPGLTADAIQNGRNGTCRLDPELVSSDVQEFLALCREAPNLPPEQARIAWEHALALYQGDLLSGRGTAAYRWVDERDEDGTTLREQYREAYFLATQQLARLYCRLGQPERAVPLLKRLLKAVPTLEDVVCDLFRCYRQLGDLGALIREERQFRQALREGYYDPDDPEDDPAQYQPEEATVRLYNQIRAELEARAGVAPRRDRDGRGRGR